MSIPQQFWDIQQQAISNHNQLRAAFPDNRIYYTYLFHIPIDWKVNHPKEYQSMLVNWYVQLTTVDASERKQPYYDELLKIIDQLVGLLND